MTALCAVGFEKEAAHGALKTSRADIHDYFFLWKIRWQSVTSAISVLVKRNIFSYVTYSVTATTFISKETANLHFKNSDYGFVIAHNCLAVKKSLDIWAVMCYNCFDNWE